MFTSKNIKEKIFSHVPSEVLKIPNLVDVQINSYKWFLETGFRELFEEISPIRDATGKDLELTFKEYYLDELKYDEVTAKELRLSYETPLRAKISLLNKRTGEIKEQDIFMGDFPIMTERGTFIINGVERVIVSQLIRSSGVYFSSRFHRTKKLFGAKLIPSRGAWLEFETDTSGVLGVRIDRKRKVPVTSLLRAFGYGSDAEIKKLFEKVDNDPNFSYIAQTLAKDTVSNQDEGLIEIYKRMKPGDLATVDNARQLIESTFFNFERYDLSSVGRYKLNMRLGKVRPTETKLPRYNKKDRIMKVEDVVDIIKEIIRLNNDPEAKDDDIDHLGNRRVKSVGELLQGSVRTGLIRVERIVKDRMSTSDIYSLTPAQLISARPFMAAVRDFFVSNQLSQFMDQNNPLAELEHRRRLSAMGPGGLTRERAGMEVRDVHTSHYGRICPIQTPEGPNIGLIGSTAVYSRINEFGFIETPYQVVKNGRITNEIKYLNALDEEKFIIAHAAIPRNEKGEIVGKWISARIHSEAGIIEKNKVQLVDVSTKQPFSVATSLIPFLAHNDANRALMSSNMQRQAVICIKAQRPFVGTGMEGRAAEDSGRLIKFSNEGRVVAVDATKIVIRSGNKNEEFPLRTFVRSNQNISLTQKPLVKKGDKVKAGQVIADGPASDNGVLALGQNLLTAFMSWGGANFEDAIIVSEKVLKEDRFNSIHIEGYTIDVRDTKLGPEVTTPDIPNVGEERLKDLDEEGVARIGAEVGPGSILVGQISPKGETELTAEERLLMAIFGEKARDVKDTSLRMPHGKYGRVVGVKIFSRDKGDKLPAGVIKSIQVEVAEYRKLAVGDKLSGRHGNKGVVAAILPEEDMPYLENGERVEVILNPLGVASRMNIGQILETHLGRVAHKKGYYAVVPPFSGAGEEGIREELRSVGFPEDGKVELYDGRTGEKFSERVTVGYAYIMKLHHLVEDKIHMRSTGPYSLITQQPLGGKAQFGGQRFGEMEVWALEGYGAAHTLQEMLTIKSDDVLGRAASYDSIIRGEKIKKPNIPASFHVLVSELKGLGLSVDLLS